MKKILKLGLLILINNISFAGTPKIYAVVVGVAAYKDNTIPNLKFSEKDAKDFSDFLKSSFAGAVPNDNIMLLIGPDATRGNIITSMVNMSKRCTKDDMVIFYFSGHGEADEGDNSGYLLSYDAASDNAPATAISMEEINARLLKCSAKLKVSYVDACHAGMFTSSGKGSMDADNEIIASSFMQSIANAGDGNVAFLASSAKQQSQESDKLGNGVFTYYLLKGLEGEADKYQKEASGYNDGLVTVGEMVTYLNDKIPAATKYNQKPTVQGVYDEDFPLSILTSNAKIADAIAKRPQRNSENKSSKPVEINHTESTTPNAEDISASLSYASSTCYGVCSFINKFSEPLLLYKYKRTDKEPGEWPATRLVGADQSSTTTNLYINNSSAFTSAKDCSNSSTKYIFYFKTVQEGKPVKYGSVALMLIATKNIHCVLSDQTLYLSTDQPKN